MLLRQFLSELDAIIILLEQGATEQCNIHLRTMLELALQVEYMTENSKKLDEIANKLADVLNQHLREKAEDLRKILAKNLITLISRDFNGNE